MLSIKELRRVLAYNPATGIFTWRVAAGKKMVAGSVAGNNRKDGYARICIDYREYYAHRLAWFYHYGAWPNRLDHKDRNPRNNAIDNLREATHSQNMANVACHRDSKSMVRGVYKHGKRWVAQVTVRKKSFYLGTHDTPEEASRAYARGAAKHFGEFACVS